MATPKIRKTKIKKEGYLDKQSSFWKTYRKRWMVLEGHMLYSFKEEKQYDNPTEIFDLRIYNKAKKSSDGKTGQFELLSPNDNRIFLASSENEMKDWIKYIKNASSSHKSKSHSVQISSSHKKRNSKSVKTKTKTKSNKNTASSMINSAKKNNTKKKKKPGNSKSVTQDSMNKHIDRLKLAQKKNTKKKKSIKKKNNNNSSNNNNNNNNNNHSKKLIVRASTERTRTGSHNKTTSTLLMDPSLTGTRDRRNAASVGNQFHKRSVSSMFGGKRRRKNKPKPIKHSTTNSAQLNLVYLDDEDQNNGNPRDFNLRSIQTSQSDRNLFKNQNKNNENILNNNNNQAQTPTITLSRPVTKDTFYTVTFESKPFGLTLNPFDDGRQIGAVVMVNHNVNDQIIKQGSRFISINNDPCKSYKFERIKNMCRNSVLPTAIKFLHSGIPDEPQTLTSSVSAGSKLKKTKKTPVISPVNIIKYNNATSAKISTKTTISTKITKKKKSPRNSPRYSNKKDDKVIKDTEKKPKKKIIKKKKQSIQQKQFKEKKAALELMKSLSGMKQIKKAESLQRLRKWKDCIQNYEKGIEELEKSLKPLDIAKVLTDYQVKECQHQIDLYCRILIKLQREHNKDILAAAEKEKTKNTNKNSFKSKKSNTNKRLSVNLSKNNKNNKNNLNNDNDYKDQSINAGFQSKKNPKRISAVALKKKEMARMAKEMKTGKIDPSRLNDSDDDNKDGNDNNNNNDGDNKVDGDPADDIYSFLKKDDPPQKTKTNKKKLNKKNNKKRKSFNNKKNNKKNKNNKNNKNNKKKNKKNNKNNGSDNDNDDDKKDDDDDDKKKKNSKMNKQDAAFRERLSADIVTEAPDISFRDVQGLINVKLALYETIILPALCPQLFTGLRTPTSGLLLFGPPGNGKTMIAKCVASQCNSTFFSISASSITSKWVGDAERIMRTLFTLAREKSPSIIFIDEIDSLLTARGGKNEAESSRKIKTEFLIQFDGVKKASDSDKRVLVIGATNLPDQLDEAVLRRFGKRIMVPLPDEDTRIGILRLLMSKQKTILTDNDFKKITSKTGGYSCSDLSTLCKDAAMGPIRALGVKILEIQNQADMPPIELDHFINALLSVRASLPAASLKYFLEWDKKFGSKIHLSINALPQNMRPYTLQEILQKEKEREEKELADKLANQKAIDDAKSDNDDDDDDNDDDNDNDNDDDDD